MSSLVHGDTGIDLKDMLYYVLKLWRKIIAFAIIIALLAGLYQVFLGLNVLLDEEKYSEAQGKYEIELRDYEATGERLRTSISNLREQSAHQQEYNEKSVLMKIDPLEKWVGSFQVYIDSQYQIDPSLSYQNLDMTNRLISAYTSYLGSGELYQEIVAQTQGIDEIRFLSEIFDVSADPGTAMITVRCVGAAESDVRQILGFVKSRIAEEYETVQNAIGDHSYQILTESVFSTIDLGLDSMQKSNLLSIADYDNQIGDTNEALNEWEKTSKPKQEFGLWHTIKQAIKSIIIFGVISSVVAFCYLALKYTLSDTCKTDDDWKHFGLPVLGRISRPAGKKRVFPWLDRLIDRAFHHVHTETLEQSCALAAQSLSAVVKEQGLTRAPLIGCLSDDSAEMLVQKLNAAVTGVSFYYAGDVLTDPSAAQNLEGSKETFLLGEKYATLCSDVGQTMTMLKAWGKRAIGVVVVE